jgi:CheY-like chemotaxis protein
MKSMLIIDRSQIISTVFTELFERRGWNVDACFDRQCALERLTGDWPYNAIIAGQVSDTAEVEIVGLIRGFEHRRTAAVLVVTEHAAVSDEALSAGADEVLLKPINLNFLMWAVDKHMTR